MFGLAADSRLALALVWPLLAGSGPRPAALVTAASPEALLDRAARDFPGVIPAVEAGSLRLFRYRATGSPAADQERLRREMDHFGIGRDALVVLHGIEPPDCASPAVFAAWRHWAEQRGHILVLVFEAEAVFQGTAREFAGLARLRDQGLGAELEVLHWFGPQGLACRQSFSLVGPPSRLAVRLGLPFSGETAAALVPIAERGYLPVSRFVEAVRAALAGSAALAVQCALVRLPVVPGLQPADALRYCALRRAGDICTADRESVHVFLFACRESDLTRAFDRLFRLPVTELFAEEVRCLSRGAILGSLDILAADADLPDLSPLLAGKDGDTHSGDDSAPLPERGMVRREAPSPAVRRPLELKRPAAQVREGLPA